MTGESNPITMPSDSGEGVMDDVYNDVSADFTLVSSDNVSFKCMKYHLLALSAEFRDMIESNNTSEPKIIFTDEWVESSCSIRMYLDFTYGRPPQPSHEILGHFRRFIVFCQKYDCKVLLWASKGFARGFFEDEKSSPQRMFKLAAQMKDKDLAAMAIRNAGEWEWEDDGGRCPPQWATPDEIECEKRNGKLQALIEQGVMQPSCWPLSQTLDIPAAYWLALMRADMDFDLTPTASNKDLEMAARCFLRLMEGQ